MSEDISSELDPNSIPSRPTFIYRSFVHSDDLDSLKFLHSERFIVHVERAITAFYRSLGLPWDVEVEEYPDLNYQLTRAPKRNGKRCLDLLHDLELIWVFFHLDVPGQAEAPVERGDGSFDVDDESLTVEKLQ